MPASSGSTQLVSWLTRCLRFFRTRTIKVRHISFGFLRSIQPSAREFSRKALSMVLLGRPRDMARPAGACSTALLAHAFKFYGKIAAESMQSSPKQRPTEKTLPRSGNTLQKLRKSQSRSTHAEQGAAASFPLVGRLAEKWGALRKCHRGG